MNTPLLERYGDRMAGVLTCYDRLVITGTMPVVCYAAGMTSFLNTNHIRIFDYPRFAEPLRDRLRENAAALAAAAVKIQFLAKAHIRMEAVVAEVITRPGPCHRGAGGLHVRLGMGMARQGDPPDVPAPDIGQVPALLFLLHRCRAWPGLSARADVVSLPLAVLLHRAPLAGPATDGGRGWLRHGRQCLHPR